MSDLVKRLRSDGALDRLNGARTEIGLTGEAADRIEHLERVLFQVRRCAYPVSTDIDPRGYRWSEAYLDQAIAAIDEALKS